MDFLFKTLKYFFLMTCILFIGNLYAAEVSPVGYWKTIDDVTGRPKSIVQIYANSDQTLSGRVVKIFPKPGEDQNKLCEPCKGDKHNQRIVGMVILEGLKAEGDKWVDGHILDPKNGKTYRCTIKLLPNGRLEVHGYIGFSVLGRTQVWLRENK